MTEDKMQPDLNGQSERAMPEQPGQQTQQKQADMPNAAAAASRVSARRRDAGRSFAAEGPSPFAPGVCLQAGGRSGRVAWALERVE